jgi:ferric-chelate reductase
MLDAEDRASLPGSEKEMANELISRLPHVETCTGRPSVQAILEDAVGFSQGPVAVTGSLPVRSVLLAVAEKIAVCGPNGMTREAKCVLRSSLVGPLSILKGGPTVDLFVETFGAVSDLLSRILR